MDLGLTGKRALVNAAAAGLGFAVATALAREGASVAISDLHAEHAREAAARIAADTGAHVHGFEADVADKASVDRLVGDASAALGGLDVLVNNAGGPPTGDFDALDESHWERGYNLTLMSVVRSIRAVLPHFETAGGGSILTLLSSSVKQPIPNLLISNVYRPGLAALTKSLAIEFAARGVRVNGLAPGRANTGRVRQLNAALAERQGKTPEEVLQASLATIPMGRLAEPDEIGRVAAFLCSPAASYVTGHVMLVDGAYVKAI